MSQISQKSQIELQLAWEKALKQELKTEDLSRFLRRSLPEGGELPLLAREPVSWFDPAFRRAALSLTWTHEADVRWDQLSHWVEQGVWDFVLDPFLLGWDDHQLKSELSEAARFLKTSEARLWVCHDQVLLPENAYRVIGAHEVTARGGHAAQELGYLLDQLIEWARARTGESVAVAVSMDREFFKSIAKKRALKALTEAAFRELDCINEMSRLTWMSRVAWRDFTAYDSTNNILRNANAVAAGYMSGAGVVESLPYDLVADLPLVEHQRAQRISLTSQLVLQQEAHLGEVSDPASGSFAIEHLTQILGAASWQVMQELQQLPHEARAASLGEACDKHWADLEKKFRQRRLIQTGVNDFPEASEKIHIRSRWMKLDHVRLARGFEELRTGFLEPKPQVAIAVVGDYAALQARLNFARNYFELLGLVVIDTGVGMGVGEARAWLVEQQRAINVWVALDEDYHQCQAIGERCYLAGKTVVDSCHNLYMGQDVLATLEALVLWWRSRT